jgi:hypothetical protein
MSEARKDIAQWLAIRKEQAKKIDPKTAKVTWVWAKFSTHTECTSFVQKRSASDVCTLHERRIAMSGSPLMIWRSQPGMLFGRTLNFAWKRMTSFSHSESERGRVR